MTIVYILVLLSSGQIIAQFPTLNACTNYMQYWGSNAGCKKAVVVK